MRHIGLMVTPGTGYRSVEVSETMSLADLVSQENLFGRTIVVDGEGVAPDAYSGTSLDGVTEVWATGAVKGA
jgi:sulfur carrier protein ThiS